MADRKFYRSRKDDLNPVIIIGALLVLIVILGGALVWIMSARTNGNVTPDVPDQPYIPDVPDQPDVPDVEPNETEVCDDSCYYQMAVKDTNLTACNQITDAEMKQDCYEELSGASLDACIAVEDASVKEECITSFAVSQDDASICDNLEENTEECKQAVNPCLDTEDQNLCFALRDEDPSKCRSDKECIIDYSLSKSDMQACDLIQNKAFSAGCKSSVDRKDYCSSLSAKSEQDYCYYIYAIYTDNFARCSYITFNNMYSLDCYSIFAARQGNVTLCDLDGFILDNKWACYRNYSLISGDFTGCEQIHDLASTNKFKCVFEFAKKYGDPSKCAFLGTTASKTTCYEGAIIYSNENLDWRNCEDIMSFDWRNKCYKEAAKIEDDVTICDNIEESFARSSCIDAYNLFKE